MPSKLSKDPVAARGHVETIPHFNTSTSQWIGSQTSGITVGVTPPQSNGIFQGDSTLNTFEKIPNFIFQNLI